MKRSAKLGGIFDFALTFVHSHNSAIAGVVLLVCFSQQAALARPTRTTILRIEQPSRPTFWLTRSPKSFVYRVDKYFDNKVTWDILVFKDVHYFYVGDALFKITRLPNDGIVLAIDGIQITATLDYSDNPFVLTTGLGVPQLEITTEPVRFAIAGTTLDIQLSSGPLRK